MGSHWSVPTSKSSQFRVKGGKGRVEQEREKEKGGTGREMRKVSASQRTLYESK